MERYALPYNLHIISRMLKKLPLNTSMRAREYGDQDASSLLTQLLDIGNGRIEDDLEGHMQLRFGKFVSDIEMYLNILKLKVRSRLKAGLETRLFEHHIMSKLMISIRNSTFTFLEYHFIQLYRN